MTPRGSSAAFEQVVGQKLNVCANWPGPDQGPWFRSLSLTGSQGGA
jgi:hypothetical protein